MSTNTKQQTTATYQTTSTALSPPQAREPRPHAVQADNQPVPLPIGLLLLTVYIILSFMLAYFGGEWAGVAVSVRLVFGSILSATMAFLTMAFITGDAATLFDIHQDERTERKWAAVEKARVKAMRDVALAESAYRLRQLDVELEQIRSDQTAQQLHIRLAEIEQRLLAGPVAAGPDRTRNYVDNHPRPAVVAVRDFVASCYGAGGFNDEMLYPNGGMRNAAPWNSIWKHEAWRADAEDIMRRYVLDDTPNQPRFRHSTNAAAQKAIPPM